MIEFIKSIYERIFQKDRLGGAERSNQWPKVRAAHLLIQPRCASCDDKGSLLKPLQVHHILPFHLNPLLELDPKNLITLCTRCHLLIGHLCSFKSFNSAVVDDASAMLTKIKKRP